MADEILGPRTDRAMADRSALITETLLASPRKAQEDRRKMEREHRRSRR